jgi:thymidylate synthase
MYDPHYVTAPRGMKINELLNAEVIISNPYSNLFKNNERSVPLKYLADELILYFMSTRNAEAFTEASPFWGTIKNPDNTVNSAYGDLIFNQKESMLSQWDWAKFSLMRDKDSRQAIMHYNRPEHQRESVKDFPCTICSQFFIRNNELHLTTYMRSNDIFFGVTFDFPFFMILMQCMRIELLHMYPNLKIGNYTHFAGSLHAYERDFEILRAMTECVFEEDEMPKVVENPIRNPKIKDIYHRIQQSDDEFFEFLWRWHI